MENAFSAVVLEVFIHFFEIAANSNHNGGECKDIKMPTSIHILSNDSLKIDLDCPTNKIQIYNIDLQCLSEWCSDQPPANLKVMNSQICDQNGVISQTGKIQSFTLYHPKISFESCEKTYDPFRTKPGRANKIRNFEVTCNSNEALGIKWQHPYPPTGVVSYYSMVIFDDNSTSKYLNHSVSNKSDDGYEHVLLENLKYDSRYEIIVYVSNFYVRWFGHAFSTFINTSSRANGTKWKNFELEWTPDNYTLALRIKKHIDCPPKKLKISINGRDRFIYPKNFTSDDDSYVNLQKLEECELSKCSMVFSSEDSDGSSELANALLTHTLYKNCPHRLNDFQFLVCKKNGCKIMVPKALEQDSKFCLLLYTRNNTEIDKNKATEACNYSGSGIYEEFVIFDFVQAGEYLSGNISNKEAWKSIFSNDNSLYVIIDRVTGKSIICPSSESISENIKLADTDQEQSFKNDSNSISNFEPNITSSTFNNESREIDNNQNMLRPRHQSKNIEESLIFVVVVAVVLIIIISLSVSILYFIYDRKNRGNSSNTSSSKSHLRRLMPS